jgi:hypothetical protein
MIRRAIAGESGRGCEANLSTQRQAGVILRSFIGRPGTWLPDPAIRHRLRLEVT